jgi:NAD(P)H-dependent FMN reductase
MGGRLLLVSGSLRESSTNTALLRTAPLVAPPDVEAVLYDGMAELPHFNPDNDGPALPRSVAELRAAIRAADAMVFSTPEYAGALPGSFKNLLDWTIGDGEPGSIYQKPVAFINVSGASTGAADAYASLRTVLAYAQAEVIAEACTPIPVTRHDVEDGIVVDPAIRAQLAQTLEVLVARAGGPGD